MEHLSTFGLTRDPFANDPQLVYWFAAPTFSEAEKRLERAALQRKGLCVVTGPPGVGKTTLVRQLLESMEEEAFETCAMVPVPGVTDGPWLLSRLARQLGVEELAETPADILGQIYEQLTIVREDGRVAVLILDEAQVLAEQGLLPMLRGLLNLEYEDRRLLTIVLVGSPELWDSVQSEPALADRVDVRFALPALDGATSAAYLTHRIRSAKGNPAILESGAVAALVKHGRGMPRLLNNLADASLFEAHLAGRLSATAEDVERAAAEVLGDSRSVPSLSGRSSEPVARAAVASAPAPPAAPGRAMPVSEHAPATAESGLDAVFGARVVPALELDEVVAAPTDPGFGSAPAPTDAGTALFPDPRPTESDAFSFGAGSGAPEATVAILPDPPAPPASPARVASSPAETVAILADPEDTNGELDDLFADLVDE